MPDALKPRLRAIAGLVPADCRCLADIGTDHGYIPAELVHTEKIQRAIAADIAPAPLERARSTARLYGVEKKIDFRLGSGLSVVRPGEADVIVIAGMGGDNITDILSAAPWSRDGSLLLLQPMSRAEVLRRWLTECGFCIQAEQLVQDKGVLYPILTVCGAGQRIITEAEAWGGILLESDSLWGGYLTNVILRLRRAAAELAHARDPALRKRREHFSQVSGELEKRKGEWMRANRTRDRESAV